MKSGCVPIIRTLVQIKYDVFWAGWYPEMSQYHFGPEKHLSLTVLFIRPWNLYYDGKNLWFLENVFVRQLNGEKYEIFLIMLI